VSFRENLEIELILNGRHPVSLDPTNPRVVLGLNSE